MRRTLPLIVSAMALLLFVARFGYVYGTGDHDELIPLVLHTLDADLYPRDAFMQEQATQFTVRTPFTVLLATLGRIVPVEQAALGLWVLVALCIGGGVWTLARSFGASRLASGGAVVVSVAAVPTWSLGGNALFYPLISPEGIGWSLVFPILLLVYKEKYIEAGFLVGACAWMHLLVGFQVGLLLGMTILFGGAAVAPFRERLWSAVQFGIPALSLALPLVFLILAGRPDAAPPGPQTPSLWFIIAELRLPHHYLPSHFPARSWLRFGILALLGGTALLLARPSAGRRFTSRFLAAAALLMGVGFIGTEGLRSLPMAQLQFFKVTVLANPLLVIWLCYGADRFFNSSNVRLLERLGYRQQWADSPPILAGLTLSIPALVVLLWFLPPSGRLGPDPTPDTELEAVERAAGSRLPAEALVLVPPSNTTFRVRTQRSVFTTFKPTPFHGPGMRKWYTRLLTIAPVTPRTRGFTFQASLDSAYAANTPDDWQKLARELHADYALIDVSETPTPPRGQPVLRSGRWALYPLRARTASPPEDL